MKSLKTILLVCILYSVTMYSCNRDQKCSDKMGASIKQSNLRFRSISYALKANTTKMETPSLYHIIWFFARLQFFTDAILFHGFLTGLWWASERKTPCASTLRTRTATRHPLSVWKSSTRDSPTRSSKFFFIQFFFYTFSRNISTCSKCANFIRTAFSGSVWVSVLALGWNLVFQTEICILRGEIIIQMALLVVSNPSLMVVMVSKHMIYIWRIQNQISEIKFVKWMKNFRVPLMCW